MRRMYSNPNKSRRTLQTERIVRLDPRIREPKADATKASQKARPLARKGYSARQVLALREHMRHIRRCKRRGLRPRKIPKAALEKVIALALV